MQVIQYITNYNDLIFPTDCFIAAQCRRTRKQSQIERI